ncbi:proteasomal ATPase-associated factor 1-like [Babylonia areolata]|uniref:proteasomal ATPase-associated factor 1-like n=1 Tax=Babylonia areolata TaxID=304850 RepID=UPI003FCFF858
MARDRIIVQHDWAECLREQGGTAWVTYKTADPPSVHSELKNHGMSQNGLPYVVAEDGFSASFRTRKTMSVTYVGESTTLTRKFVAPNITFSTIHKAKKGVHCVDVTSEGLGVSCDTAGNLLIWQTDSGEIRRELRGHLGDVYRCRFFPSGVVVLSVGADMQAKIWSAETGKEAANIVGHRAAILDCAIVERGRNIVTCSRDGTARLWDVSQQAELFAWTDLGGDINCCALAATDNSVQLGVPDEAPSEKEILTEGKMLVLGSETGSLLGFGLHSRKPVFDVSCGSAVNCCRFLSDTQVACGTQGGEIFVIDARNPSKPLRQWKESRSAVLSMLTHKQGLFISTGDGSLFYVNEEYETMVEMTGSDCDPVYSIARDGSHIYSSCRDGTVSKYSLNLV